MADPFQPKFADLVRNMTTTIGTGNLVLGGAAPGFSSFTDVLQPGDRFYYSVVGVDKPDESEVGRGTLQADGTIAREPIGGLPTDFSTGTKSVALVAAAEWFEAVDEGRETLRPVATRGALAALPSTTAAALLTEAGRDGLFRFDPSDHSAKVAADTAQGLFVAPSTDPTGASGAWVRSFDGPVNPSWFGLIEGDAAGANAVANDAAIAAMLDTLATMPPTTAWETFRSLNSIEFGCGTFEFSAPIELKTGAVSITGQGMGHGGYDQVSGATRLHFFGSTGILIQAPDTSGATTKDAELHPSGAASEIRSLSIEGDFDLIGVYVEGEVHGVHARGAFHALNVNVRNFRGDAWHVVGDTNTVGGNANGFTMVNCTGWGSRNGLYIDGNNSNAGTIVGGRFNDNRQWGVWDSSFLGNNYLGVHTSFNGVMGDNDGSSIGVSVVSHNGNRYCAVADQEAWCSANSPSGDTSDNEGWIYLYAGAPASGRPAWSAGLLIRAGGCVRDDNINSRGTYSGCYTEKDEGKAQIANRSLVTGGMLSDWVYASPNGGGAVFDANGTDGLPRSAPGHEVTSGNVSVRLGHSRGNAANRILFAKHATESPNGHVLQFDANLHGLMLTYSGETASSIYQMLITGPTTLDQFGTGIAQPHSIYFPRLMVGDDGKTRANARQLLIDTAAPSTGAHGQGEWVLYRGADPNLIGFNCLAAGSPGTWQAVYGLTQLQASGSGLQASASDTLLGRASAGSGELEEISCTAAGRALLADADAAEQRSTLGLSRGIAFHCAGAPAASEVLGGGIAPYDLNLSAANSSCRALVAATGAVTLEIRNNGVQIGAIAFAASATTATVTFTNVSVVSGDQITIHNPAAADATLADIDGLLAE